MESRRMAVEMPDGSITIICPAGEFTVEDIIGFGDVPKDSVKELIVEVASLPSRSFRGAWKLDASSVLVDMKKARDIHMDRIREFRDKELRRLDGEYIEALEDNDTAKENAVKAQKQTLRDIPQTFKLDSFKKSETLEAAWPAEVPNPNGS